MSIILQFLKISLEVGPAGDLLRPIICKRESLWADTQFITFLATAKVTNDIPSSGGSINLYPSVRPMRSRDSCWPKMDIGPEKDLCCFKPLRFEGFC